MFSKNQMRKAVIITFCLSVLLFGAPLIHSYQKIVELQEDISILSDKDTIQIARKIKNSDYSYEEYITGYADQIAELEANLNGKDTKIEVLERQIEDIQNTYEVKLSKMMYEQYHLESDILSDEQLRRADEIAHIVASHYEEYGVLPSVAVGQAMQESQLGVVCPENNLWGINTGTYSSYPSLYDGVMKYLKVINNGLYDGALFEKDPLTALTSIQNGGYCVPKDGYASKVLNCIYSYDFTRYDEYYLEE